MGHKETLSEERLSVILVKTARWRNIQGDVPGALALLLPYTEKANDATLLSVRFWKALGTAYRDSGDAPNADSAYEKGFALAIHLGKDVKAAEIRVCQAMGVLLLEQDSTRATDMAQQTEELLNGHQAKEARVNLKALRGNILMAQGNYSAAKKLFAEALHDSRPLKMKNRKATVCGDLAHLYIQTGDYPEAIAALEGALELYCEEHQHLIPFLLVRLSHAYRMNGNYIAASEKAQDALAIAIRLKWNLVLQQAYDALQMANTRDSGPHLWTISTPHVAYYHLVSTQCQSLPSDLSCGQHD